MTTISGLLTQKPTSPVPKCGEKHRYSVTERISKTGKPWTKVKSEGEGYGQLYEVITVEKTEFVDPHGNVSFNVVLVPLDLGGHGTQGEPATKTLDPAAAGPASTLATPAQSHFWDVYRQNLIDAESVHTSLLPPAAIEGMSEYEFQRLNQVAAISATIQAHK